MYSLYPYLYAFISLCVRLYVFTLLPDTGQWAVFPRSLINFLRYTLTCRPAVTPLPSGRAEGPVKSIFQFSDLHGLIEPHDMGLTTSVSVYCIGWYNTVPLFTSFKSAHAPLAHRDRQQIFSIYKVQDVCALIQVYFSITVISWWNSIPRRPNRDQSRNDSLTYFPRCWSEFPR